jgi:hypothetical protein
MKGFKGVGLYGIHVSVHQDYVLGASGYKVCCSRVIRVKVYRGYRDL